MMKDIRSVAQRAAITLTLVRATRHRDHLDRRIVTTEIGAS